MTSDEGQMRAACVARDAAERMAQAASSIENSVHRLEILMGAGYGGPGQELIELLSNHQEDKGHD